MWPDRRHRAKGDAGKDAAGVAKGKNMIFDHLSVSWGRDETFSISGGNADELGEITIQNCLIAQGLMNHSAGGLIQANHITLYRNVYVDNNTRNNKVKGTNQYVNNLVYNWSNGCYIMGGESQMDAYCNVTDNLFINGPCGDRGAFSRGNEKFHLYAARNWQDRDRDGKLNPYLIPKEEYPGPDFQDQPFDYPALPVWEATALADSLLPTVGASRFRDRCDRFLVEEVRSFGSKGAFISDEATLPFGIPTTWTIESGQCPADTDGDGLPDEWEKAHNTNPKKADSMKLASNGYTYLENYINSLVP